MEGGTSPATGTATQDQLPQTPTGPTPHERQAKLLHPDIRPARRLLWHLRAAHLFTDVSGGGCVDGPANRAAFVISVLAYIYGSRDSALSRRWVVSSGELFTAGSVPGAPVTELPYDLNLAQAPSYTEASRSHPKICLAQARRR